MLAADAHTNERHITFLDQYVEASSRENSTPPTGAPNAAASPAAAPALTNSRRVKCDDKSIQSFVVRSRDLTRSAFDREDGAYDRARSALLASPSSDRG